MLNVQEAVIPFHGGGIVSIRDGDDVWVSINQACSHVGIASQPQITKLRKKPWAKIRDDLTVPNPGGGARRAAVLLHIDSLPMWLATIEPSRVAPHARHMLESYQVESANALRDYWYDGAAVNPRKHSDKASRQLARLRGMDVRKDFTDVLKEVYETSDTTGTFEQWCINFTKSMTKQVLGIDENEFSRRKKEAGGNFRNSCSEAELNRIAEAEKQIRGLSVLGDHMQIKELYEDTKILTGLLSPKKKEIEN